MAIKARVAFNAATETWPITYLPTDTDTCCEIFVYRSRLLAGTNFVREVFRLSSEARKNTVSTKMIRNPKAPLNKLMPTWTTPPTKLGQFAESVRKLPASAKADPTAPPN
jgi:hypothetical protein